MVGLIWQRHSCVDLVRLEARSGALNTCYDWAGSREPDSVPWRHMEHADGDDRFSATTLQAALWP